MLQQFLTVPGFTGATSDRLTSLAFPSPLRTQMTVDERVAELELWQRRIRDPRFPDDSTRSPSMPPVERWSVSS